MTNANLDTTVKSIASRMLWDYEAWKNPTHGQVAEAGYASMQTGLFALIQFGYARDYVWDNGNNPNYKRIEATLEHIWRENPVPTGDPDRVPTKADVEASAAWARRVEDLLLLEFAPKA